ncbi:hypothetical protein [Rhodopirellula sp. MGV]|uniref:hypothetical protein n=1 Tax=Rhodopirellula sp. MGV TaxID=2023130 RepID=UPI00117B23C2|nr:hypothetical protein [Rhodopirellula sp. MGV]
MIRTLCTHNRTLSQLRLMGARACNRSLWRLRLMGVAAVVDPVDHSSTVTVHRMRRMGRTNQRRCSQELRLGGVSC